MNTNDLNRRLRYAFMLDDQQVSELLSLASYAADLESIIGWRKKPEDEGFIECPADALDGLLNGLITQRRGPREDSAATAEPSNSQPAQSLQSQADVDGQQFVDNNTLLKQLRIALSLKTDDVHQLITEGGGKLGKSEVNALFRKPSARNYRRCGDQVLRWFLAGVAARRETI